MSNQDRHDKGESGVSELDVAVAGMWIEESGQPELDDFVNAIIERARLSVGWLAVA